MGIEFSFLDFELDKIFCFWLVYCCAFITMLYSIKLLFLIFYTKFNYYKSKSLNHIYEGGFIGFGNIYIYNSILQLPKSISFFEIECFIEILTFYNINFFYYILLKYLPIYSTFFGLF